MTVFKSYLRALIGSFFLFFSAIPSDAKELSLAFPFGTKNIVYQAVILPFENAVKEQSKGELAIKTFPGGALNSDVRMQYSILTQGVADIAYVLPGHTGDLFPITSAISLPNFAKSAVDGTNKLWNAKALIGAEFKGKILALWSGPTSVLVTRDQPVRSLQDVQGMRVRVASPQEAVFVESYGASPIAQPAILASQNLANGVIDAISIGAGAIPIFHLEESAKYVTVGTPSSTAAFVLLMNQSAFDDLTPQQQDWIVAASGKALSLKAAEAFDEINARAIDYVTDKGLEVIYLPPAEAARYDAAMNGAVEAFLDRHLGNGVTGRDVIATMRGD